MPSPRQRPKRQSRAIAQNAFAQNTAAQNAAAQNGSTGPDDAQAQLAELREALARQGELLAGATRTEEAAGRLGALVEQLPERLGAVLRDAARLLQDSGRPGDVLSRRWSAWRPPESASAAVNAELLADLQETVATVRESGTALRGEVARLVALREAFSQSHLAVAQTVEQEAGATADRLAGLARRLDDAPARPPARKPRP